MQINAIAYSCVSNYIDNNVLCHVGVKCQDVKLTDEERTMYIDLEPFMNPAPYTVPLVSSPLHSATGKLPPTQCHLYIAPYTVPLVSNPLHSATGK